MSRPRQPKPFSRRPSALSAGRTATIARLIEAHVVRTGIEPSDAELASLCAISIERVRRHLAALARRAR